MRKVSKKIRAQKWAENGRSKKRRKGLSYLSRLRSLEGKALYGREINELRVLADRISVITGVRHTVDHIYPLSHPDFCGLTVPWNMQVLPHSADNAKGNTRPEDVKWLGFSKRKKRPKKREANQHISTRSKVKGWTLGEILMDARRG